MSGGGSTSETDTRFSREGTVETSNFRELTPEITGLFQQALGAVQPMTANASVDQMLAGRINSPVSSRPYAPEICNIIRSNAPGIAAPGQDMFERTMGQDPYSGAFANNTFSRYAQDVQNAMSMARSGPAMTRGGTAAQGFAQAQTANELGLNREQVVQNARNLAIGQGQAAAQGLSQARGTMDQNATNAANVGYNGYYNFLQNMLSSAGLASERTKQFADLVPTYATISTPMKGTELNNLRGRGSQSSTSFGASFSLCCFIFMEAYNGELPWYVRACRDEFAPESSARRNGYIKMSRWLVPMMRVSRMARTLVNHLLIKPLTRWGAHYKGVLEGPPRWCDSLAKNAWFKLWELTGRK